MNMILKRTIRVEGGRDGSINDPEGNLSLSMRKPKEMGGTGGAGTNPEALFAAGYASCFAGSLEFLLAQDGVSYDGLAVETTVKLIPDGDAGFKFALDSVVSIGGLEEAVLSRYVEGAKAFCPFSKAIRNNIAVNVTIE